MGRPHRRIQITAAALDHLREIELEPSFHHKVRLRASVLRLHAAGWTVAQLAHHFDRNPQAILNDLTRFEQHGIQGLADRPPPGQPRLVTPAVEHFLHEKVQENQLWNATLLQAAVLERFEVRIGTRALTNHLHRLGYSWKRASISPAKTPDAGVVQHHAASIETLKRGHWKANSP